MYHMQQGNNTGSTYIAPQSQILQLQRRCASQIQPVNSLGRSPSPRSRTLVCSHAQP